MINKDIKKYELKKAGKKERKGCSTFSLILLFIFILGMLANYSGRYLETKAYGYSSRGLLDGNPIFSIFLFLVICAIICAIIIKIFFNKKGINKDIEKIEKRRGKNPKS